MKEQDEDQLARRICRSKTKMKEKVIGKTKMKD